MGTTVEQPQMFGPPKSEHIDGEPLALAALACAVVGVLVGLARGGGGRTGSIVLALAGGVLLLALQSKVGRQAQTQGMGMLAVKYEIGYWVAMLGYLAALLSSFGGSTSLAPSKLPPLPAADRSSG